ncbi:MAG: c-type cytochrome [Burkholderiales bacterium]
MSVAKPHTPNPSQDDKAAKAEGVIKKAIGIALGSVAGIFAIVLIAQYSISAYQTRERNAKIDPAMAAAAVAERIKPVGQLRVVDASAPKVSKSGQQVYEAVCAACHATGLLSAPKFGDKAGWGDRLKQGYDTLVTNAIKGIRQMPAKGGAADLDDVEVARAVAYIGKSAGADYREPDAPVPVATAPVAGKK